MTEEDAKGWIAARFGDAAVDRIARFLAAVAAENLNQNLIAPSTVEAIWSRHAVDSAQLLALADDWSAWIDIGTGGGFPGMIVALLGQGRAVTMVEPRRKRAAFLQQCVETLRVSGAVVQQTTIEKLAQPSDVISARAVSSIDTLLQRASPCATKGTTWLLPRGGLTDADRAFLASLASTMFHVEHSITGQASAIVILKGAGR